MKIVNDKPPIYDKACAAFTVSNRTVFCYGDVLYNPNALDLSPDLIAHEQVHCGQQGEDPADWWEKYLVDAEFRLDQELAAYKEQYKFICNQTNDREKRNTALVRFAMTLSSSLYGKVISMQEAVKLIRQ